MKSSATSSLSDFARTAAENADLAGISPEFALGMFTYPPKFGENPASNLDSLARTLKVRQAASRFWKTYSVLPAAMQQIAFKQYQLWMVNSRHPSLQFKKVGPFWSVRVNDDYRSLALLKDGTYFWFWIGTHAEYDRILKGK